MQKTTFLKIVQINGILRTFYRFHSTNKRICIVGSGPAGFYTAQHLLKNKNTEVDIIEKLPVPFGLIRYGVAPDHPEIKNVINTFTKVASNDRCKFYGNISVGQDVTVPELLKCYHAVVLAYGSDSDKKLNIPGEESQNVLSARKLVGWYTGHPDFINVKVDLNTEAVAVVGTGNVALDVARILLRNPDELKSTDISEHAFDSLIKSKVKRVVLLGRRGPLQAAFTIKEFREMTKLSSCNIKFNPLDFNGVPELIPNLDRSMKRLAELMCDVALNKKPNESGKVLELKFFRNPKAIIPDAHGRASKFILGINTVDSTSKDANIIVTDEEDSLDCGLIVRSIGYQSIAIDPHVPFDVKKHVIPNKNGKVDGVEGLYCSGWVKTGPIGVIVSTMYESYDTADSILKDIDAGHLSKTVDTESLSNLLNSRGVKYVTFDDWKKIDQIELQKGQTKGKVREKIYIVDEMIKIVK